MISSFSVGVVQSAAECVLHQKKKKSQGNFILLWCYVVYIIFVHKEHLFLINVEFLKYIFFSHRPHTSARCATSGDGPVVYRADNPPFWHITRKNSVRSQNVSSCRKVRILCDATKLFNSFSVGFHCEIF